MTEEQKPGQQGSFGGCGKAPFRGSGGANRQKGGDPIPRRKSGTGGDSLSGKIMGPFAPGLLRQAFCAKWICTSIAGVKRDKNSQIELSGEGACETGQLWENS